MKGELIQNLMDEVYKKWNTPECREQERLDVINKFFSNKHKVAVQLGNMNYQVCNGGWTQWHLNRYDEDLEDLIEYAKKGVKQNIKHFDILLNILTEIKALGEPEDYDRTDMCECSECSGNGYIYEYDEDNNEIKTVCPECFGEGSWEEEIEGIEEYHELLSKFDDKYYDIDEEELLTSFDEFIERFSEEVDITDFETPITKKPRCKLVGTDGNIFSVLGKVQSVLKEMGLKEQAEEVRDRVFKSHSYDEALSICCEYVDAY